MKPYRLHTLRDGGLLLVAALFWPARAVAWLRRATYRRFIRIRRAMAGRADY